MGSMREETREALYDRQRRLEEALGQAQTEETRVRIRRELDELQLTRSDLETMEEDRVRAVYEKYASG